MNRYDFTNTGGFPFTQDVLKDMQEQYLAMIQKMAGALGPGPYIISGMVQSGGAISDGWFYYNGDMVPFTGGTIPTPAGTDVVLIQITNAAGTLIYNNGSSPVAIVGPGAVLITGPTATTSTKFPLSALQAFGKEANWTQISVTTTGMVPVGGNFYYRKNFLSNSLYIRGSFEIDVASIGFTPSYHVFSNLPAGYRPANKAPFKAIHQFSSGFLYDGLSTPAPLKDFNCYIDTTGNINVGAHGTTTLAGGTFFMDFNAIIPLD